MPTPGPLELIVILIIALVVIGPGRLPDVGAALGKSIREFRKASSDLSDAARIDAPAATSAGAASEPQPSAPPSTSTPATNPTPPGEPAAPPMTAPSAAPAPTPEPPSSTPTASTVPAPLVIPNVGGDDETDRTP